VLALTRGERRIAIASVATKREQRATDDLRHEFCDVGSVALLDVRCQGKAVIATARSDAMCQKRKCHRLTKVIKT
jgi:hypothetical protein